MYKTNKQYYAFHKPYGVLCQFTKEHISHVTLEDYISLDTDVYPVGRLDKDSEGLLLLTNDNRLKTYLLSPKSQKYKTYWAQVEGSVDDDAIDRLKKGVDIKVNKKIYHTLPARVRAIAPPVVEDRNPPIRYRAEIPTSWIEISIREGKNRQIRRMCAAVGFPVLRLIRTAIQDLTLSGVKQGELKQLDQKDVDLLLK